MSYGEKVTVTIDQPTTTNHDYILVECEDINNKIIFRHLHKQITPKDKNIHGVPFQKRRELYSVTLVCKEYTCCTSAWCTPLSTGTSKSSLSVVDLGVAHGNGTIFFRFHIHFHQNGPRQTFAASPPMG